VGKEASTSPTWGSFRVRSSSKEDLIKSLQGEGTSQIHRKTH